MITVGIDVSKGKSEVAAKTSPSKVVLYPFEIQHNTSDIDALVKRLKAFNDPDLRIVVESTGRYHEALTLKLYESGFSISVRNPKLTSGFDNDSLRDVKNDKLDALKLADYGIERWYKLQIFIPLEAVYASLRDLNRQLAQYNKQLVASKLNLTSLLDVVYPDITNIFKSNVRKDGHQKWMDFIMTFWHCRCVSSLSEKKFCDRYQKWCKKNQYNYSLAKAKEVYDHACSSVTSKPKDESVKLMVTVAMQHIIDLQILIQTLKSEMLKLAVGLPEYSILISTHGVGDTLAPQIIAEIGDIRRFSNKKKLVAYAGIDPPQYQSGKYEANDRHITKRGMPLLRKALFLTMSSILQNKKADDPVYQYLDKKRAEGKHYLSYMMAGSRKFLHIYYAKAREQLSDWDQNTDILD